MQSLTVEILLTESNAEFAGLARHFLQIGTLHRRSGVRIAGFRSMRAIEHSCAVTHTSRENMFTAKSGNNIAKIRS